MPIGALTNHVAGAVMNLATMVGNNQLIEDYLRGEVDAADFQDLISRPHGIPGSNHRAYIQAGNEGLDSNPKIYYDRGEWQIAKGSPYGTPIPLDRDCELDFTIYDNDALYLDAGVIPKFKVPSNKFIAGWVWEKLGANPYKADLSKVLTTAANSWCNWLYNAPIPTAGGVTNFKDSRDEAGRFDSSDYMDRWLTVPYGCKRIWCPNPGMLYVMGTAHGTWNHNMNPMHASAVTYHRLNGANGSALGQYWYDKSCLFRLFIDNDNSNLPSFEFDVNGETFRSNWTSIQDLAAEPRIGYGGNNDPAGDQGKMLGWEWSSRSLPKGVIRVASKIWVPVAGYYNISLRYNSRYCHGVVDPTGATADWKDDRFGCVDEDDWPGTDVKFRDEPGPINIARWEKVQLGAILHFKQGPRSTVTRKVG